jgi:hypothetical protein
VTDIKKRMEQVRRKYLPAATYRGPAEARHRASVMREEFGEAAMRELESHLGQDLEKLLEEQALRHPLVLPQHTAARGRAQDFFGTYDAEALACMMAEVLFPDDRGRPRGHGVDLYEIACARALMLKAKPTISDPEVARRLIETGGIYKDYDDDSLRQLVFKARRAYGDRPAPRNS